MTTPIPENRAPFTLAEILRETSGALAHAAGLAEDHALAGVSTDTRAIRPGAAFVALKGEAHDGHDHLDAALLRGARVAIVEHDPPELAAPEGLAIVRVPSTLVALGDLARAHARRWRSQGGVSSGGRVVVGITGSAGKTTTRLATAAILERLRPGRVHGSAGNLNNRIGVPMVLLGLTPAHDVAVVEMGMNRPGEIAELARIAEPEIGVLTLIAAAHTELCGSIDGVAAEKGALFRALPEGGLAIGNADDARVRKQLITTPARRHHTYGRAFDADVRIAERRVSGLERSEIRVDRIGQGEIAFSTPLLGMAGALACAAAIAVAELGLGERVTSEIASAAFAGVDTQAGAGRLAPRIFPSGLAVIDDSYNGNPASTCASITAARELAEHAGRRLVLVLGEMKELGESSASGHEDVGRAAAASGAAHLVAIGGEAARIAALAAQGGVTATFVERVEDAAVLATHVTRPSDLVLVKGSRSVGAERVVRALAAAHDDPRAVVAASAGDKGSAP
jgi:UDP-N-acetylmuramoyl-tripeptide--D-alanyl-D-alanine ligase